MPDVTRVLMPGEFRPDFGRFDDVLLVEQIDIIAQCGAANIGHQVAEQKRSDGRAVPPLVGDEIAFFVMGDAHRRDAFGFHFAVTFVDKALAFHPQPFQRIVGNHVFEDKITFRAILFDLRICNPHDLLSSSSLYTVIRRGLVTNRYEPLSSFVPSP